MEADAARVGQKQKPEAYYFPKQLNNHGGDFPYTFFGLLPGTTREDIKNCLRNWDRAITRSQSFAAYKLQPARLGCARRRVARSPVACAPTTRNLPAMSLRCSNRWWLMFHWLGVVVKNVPPGIITIWTISPTCSIGR